MSSFSFLLDLPAVPRVLRLLLQTPEGIGEECVIERLPDGTCAQTAIDKLVRQGVIRKENGNLFIAEGEENSRKVDSIIRFYAAVERTAHRGLLFRGILNATRNASLIHLETFMTLMEIEGFAREEVNGVLDEDAGKGYIERFTVMYRTRQGMEHHCFSSIPLYCYPNFLMMRPGGSGRLRERLKGTGIIMIEEEYLLGRYPKEIADQSREYVIKEKQHIRERIRNDAYDVGWYYRA